MILNKINWRAFRQLSHLGLSLLFVLPLLVLCVAQAIALGINYYLIGFCLSLFVLAWALVFYRLQNKRRQQMGILADLLEALIQGDYSLRGTDLYTADFQALLALVNQLASVLQNQTLALQEKQVLLQQLIEHMQSAVLAIDSQGKVIFHNRAAQPLLEQSKNQLSALLNQANGKSVHIGDQQASQGQFLLHKEHFYLQGQRNQLVVLNPVDALLQQHQVQAWQKLVRVLTHEINNAMAPIHTISGTMLRQAEQQNWSANTQQALQSIQSSSAGLIDFIGRYAKVAKLPQPHKSLHPLADLISQATALVSTRPCQISGLAESDRPLELYCDSGQLQQVLVNLLKNADQAMSDPSLPIAIEISQSQQQLTISIRDQGTGISNPANLFVPFYTTKSQGSGIGLMLSQQILLNHGGQLQLQNRQDGILGAVATVVLPWQAVESGKSEG